MREEGQCRNSEGRGNSTRTKREERTAQEQRGRREQHKNKEGGENSPTTKREERTAQEQIGRREQ